MVKIDDLSREIARQVGLYTEDVREQLFNAEEKVANEAVKELRKRSPRSKGGGGYAKGWTKKRVNGKLVIYNKTKPGLAHLLENGHLKADGDRTRAIKHIRPVEEEAVKTFLQLAEKAIKP